MLIVLRGVNPDGKAAHHRDLRLRPRPPLRHRLLPRRTNPKYVYVGNATTVQRFPYHSGDLHATGPAETIVPDIPGYAQLAGGGHWTRDVVFSKDGKHMLVSVGSGSNVDDADTHPREFHRADVLEYTPDGKFEEVYAHGIRNCVGEAINPITGQLWCSTNERDNLGNHLVPDYVTSVPEGSFFGWPWYYMGGHLDPRLPGPLRQRHRPQPAAHRAAAPSTRPKTASARASPPRSRRPTSSSSPTWPRWRCSSTPNTFQSIGTVGQTPPSTAFPVAFAGDAFAAEHGSWNRKNRAGYEVISIPMHDGHATGEYDDFLTGFVTADGQVWGRPVGVAVGNDGSLFVTDDGSRSVWHVTYTGK